MEHDPGGGYITTSEAAGYLSVSPRTIRRLIASRQIPAYRPHGKIVRLRIADLDAWMQARRVASEAPPNNLKSMLEEISARVLRKKAG